MQDNPYGVEALWLQGDWVIKTVALTLLLMSVASWCVILIRAWGLLRLRTAQRSAFAFWHAKSFDEGLILLGNSADSPFRHLADEAQAAVDHHAQHKSDLHGHLPMGEWLTASLRTAIDETAELLQRGLSILASVGATAPFVGLFGTVWGIYRALVGIGVSGQASIDKVAGPVGEALIMTAFGLAVAIPAVLGYNALTRSNKRLLGQINRFAHQLHTYFLTGAPPARSRTVPLKAVGGGR